MTHSIAFNIAKLRQRIASAEQKYQRRPESVQLMAVSKTRPAAMIRAAAAAGITEIGENYLQEALDKQAELRDLPLCWHFIGPIQSNKTAAIAGHFDWVHSVDREKIARRLNNQRPQALPPLNICLQLNVSQEASKSGVSVDQLAALAETVAALPRLCLRGIMAIPKASRDMDQQRQAFAEVSAALAGLRSNYTSIDTLSMGMSGDMEAAIAEGSTVVRIGTDIFGPRDYSA